MIDNLLNLNLKKNRNEVKLNYYVLLGYFKHGSRLIPPVRKLIMYFYIKVAYTYIYIYKYIYI